MKVNKLSLLLLILMALSVSRCDTSHSVDAPGDNYFLKFIGEEGNQTGVDFEVFPDGSMILLGSSTLADSVTHLYLVKVDPQGNYLWEKIFPGTRDVQPKDVELTADGNMVVLSNVYTSGSIVEGGSRDIQVMTLSSDGAIINSVVLGYKKKGTAEDADDDANSVTQIKDGGFAIAGSTDNLGEVDFVKREGLLIKLTNDLTQNAGIWRTPPGYGSAEESVTTKIIQLSDSVYYVFGYAKWAKGPQADFDFWYFAINGAGVTSSDIGSFGARNTDEKMFSVAQVSPQLGDGFLLGGTVRKIDGSYDVYMGRLQYPLSFDDQDPRIVPGPMGFNLGPIKNQFVSVCVSQSGYYFILTNDALTGNNNLRLTKIDGSNGTQLWSEVYGGQGDDFSGAVRELPDGRIGIFGTMSVGLQNRESKMVLIKVNRDGQFVK